MKGKSVDLSKKDTVYEFTDAFDPGKDELK